MADWRAPVVAVEDGKVSFFYAGSSRGGCLLYLYGKSGTTYMYIHLNNDLTARSEDRGGCKEGVAYAPGLRDGQKVKAGQLLAYVGDSGDAEGIHPTTCTSRCTRTTAPPSRRSSTCAAATGTSSRGPAPATSRR